jgi:hypothetical protein
MPDLSMTVKDENPPSGQPTPEYNADSLSYDFQHSRLGVGTRQLVAEGVFSHSSMASVSDLCDSQLWIALFNTSAGYPVTPLVHQMRLKLVTVAVGSRPFVIQDFKEYQSPNLGYFYSYTFPKTEEALDALRPK